jgi:hypothetical protein
LRRDEQKSALACLSFKIQFRKECGFDSYRPHHRILQVPRSPPHGRWNLHQWSALGWTARAPLREMTIERYCHAGTWQAIRDAVIATNRRRIAMLAYPMIDRLSPY